MIRVDVAVSSLFLQTISFSKYLLRFNRYTYSLLKALFFDNLVMDHANQLPFPNYQKELHRFENYIQYV